MYQLFGFIKIVGIIASLSAMVGLISAWCISADGLSEWLSVSSKTGTIVGLIIIGLGESPLFRKIWKIQFIQDKFFPYIHGRWEGQIQSNWSVISAIREAASGLPNSVDVNSIDMHTIGSMKKDVTVEITATFLFIRMKLIPKDGYTDSETIFVKPEKNGDGGYPCLYYMYRTKADIPQGDDEKIHYGAAKMDIRLNSAGGLNIVGNYWTERNWQKGMNTAGTLDINKVA